MSIKVENLTKKYGTQLALNNISFTLNPGEILGFLGPNGAGKSTTMKIITGYIPPTSGTAYVCGYNIEENPIEVKKRIGYLPELNPLYTEMYVKEFLLFTASTYQITGKKALQAVENMIERTGLTPERNKKINQLSKGYKQRVGLAAAMLHNPDVLILDEPTSGLDPNQVVEIRTLIKEIGKDKSVILSTHIMQEVKAMCNRVIIINKGNIVADNNLTDMQQSVNQTCNIRIEVKGNVDMEKIKKLNHVTHVKSLHNGFMITAKNDVREELAKLAINEGWLIMSMSIEEADLENIFQLLTR